LRKEWYRRGQRGGGLDLQRWEWLSRLMFCGSKLVHLAILKFCTILEELRIGLDQLDKVAGLTVACQEHITWTTTT